MRCRTKWAGLLLLLALGSGPGSAQAVEPDRGPLVYVDVLSLGVGLALASWDIRGGVEWPLDHTWAVSSELGLHGAQTPGVSTGQIDLSGTVRWRPEGTQGPYLAGGIGLAWAEVVGAAGGPDQGNTVGVKTLVLTEAGWTIQRSDSLVLEPFARGNVAVGPEFPGGKASGARGWGFRTTLSSSVGFRIGWRFPGGKE